MPSMTLTKPRKKRCVHQPEEAPFPIPIETITNKPATNRNWFFYQAQMIDNNVIVQNEGDIVFLSKMGFFGKGILSRSKPEHQFFASSFQGSQRRNLPPKERRFQQQRFQQVRQHKYERHLSWQKQLSLQRSRRDHGEVKEPPTTLISEDSMQNPSYRVPTVPAKRVKRATISERNQRAGIMTTTDHKKELPAPWLVPESKDLSVDSSQPGRDGQRMASEDAIVPSTHQAHHGPTMQIPTLAPSRDGWETADVDGNGRIKSPMSHSGEDVESRQEVSCRLPGVDHLRGTDDSEASKFVFQSETSGVRHTVSSSEPTSSCLPNSVSGKSSQRGDASEKMLSSGQSESVWETRHADWANCMEGRREGDAGQDETKNHKGLLDSSRNRTSVWSMSSWRTDPKDWDQDQDGESKLRAQFQSGQRQEGISNRENTGPSQTMESESVHNGGQDGVTDGAPMTSGLGMDQTSIEGEKKRSSGHLSWSEEWTSNPRDWDMGDEDQALISTTLDQVHKDSEEEDQGFDDSCEVSEQQSDQMEPSTSKKSLESNKAPERDTDCNPSNAEDSFVAVPTLVEFEDATTSQTESNNILSLKGRDARKKIREVNKGPVRHKDPYPIFEYLQLSYEEAFFLSYGLGCLSLRNANEEQMDLTEMWKTFRRHQPSFVANYIVYHFFRSKGWVPKTGLKFGADFILYKKGPPFYHASYCVYVFMINEEDIDHQGIHKMNWASLMGRDRVIENAAKELMFCFVIKPSKLLQKDLDSPACIPHFKVQEMVMKRWVPSRGRHQEPLEEELS
eukprot:XP_784204.3 PREDICTED: tRNA-splicing endonuclease subunit Sen2 [Strongylocentrotus purpuratus]